MKSDDTRTCLVCGTQFPAVKEFCPICMLREALDEQVKPAQRSSKSTVISRRGKRLLLRLDHYELLAGEDGKPVELGRGAMGVTYKGFDVDLRCPVTLKVSSERYLGDESARLRFLREARAAAKVRHSNVASVLHLGKTGKRYFYAMESRRGRDPRESHQALWAAGGEVGHGNYRASRRRFGCGTRTEFGSPGHQTE
jgi:hypothetical protein